MKIFWNATLFWWLLIMGCNIHEASSAYDLLLSCGNSVTSGSDCTMTCDTKMPSASAIQWYNGSTMTAVETVNCSNAGDLPYVSSCNTPGKFNLKITNAQFGRDSYAWSCSGPFGGDTSNATDGDTFVTVPLTRVTLTKPDATSISCVAVSNPAANVTLYEGSTPSQDKVIKTETSFTRTMDGFETQLTSAIEESKTYFCLGDNGVHVVNATNVPAPPTTPSPPDASSTTDSNTTQDSITPQSSSESSSSSASVESSTAPSTSESSNSPTSVEITTAPPTSESSSSSTSIESMTSTTATAEPEPFACQSNCVEEIRRIYLSIFIPVLILVAIDVVAVVSVVCSDRGQHKTA